MAFAAFIAFFPQLVAGPIERSTQLLPQFLQPRSFDYGRAVDGMRQILWGFFKKLVIADNCAMLANNVFEHNTGGVNSSLLLLGALFFTFQIYGDFSGYSDIAVGTAKLFGIRLMRNFNLPYFSRDIAEFWRRWHISLNTWFTDYVYIPLGGSRRGRGRTLVNIMIVFILSGLWHGAAWTFVVWGLYNGLLIVLCRLAGIKNSGRRLSAPGRFFPSVRDAGMMLLTFILVMVGWVIFRSETLSMARDYLCGICTPSLFSAPAFGALNIATFYWAPTLFFIAVLQAVEWCMRDRAFGLDIGFIQSRALRWGIYLALIMVMTVFAGTQAQFIYFQF
ncbi:MAG: hypothetical protein NC333_06450 [Terasakiella sp.]|nr:hypothetical protein [Terasakiella sp.]